MNDLFVYIIESPSNVDLLHGRQEGCVLSEALRLANIPHWYSLTSDRTMLDEALGLSHRLGFKGWSVDKCVESMKIASGNSQFTIQYGRVIKLEWLTFIQQYAAEIERGIRQAASYNFG